MSRICCVPLLIWVLSPAFPFRSISGEQAADGYGKGYSLTVKGLEKVATVKFGVEAGETAGVA